MDGRTIEGNKRRTVTSSVSPDAARGSCVEAPSGKEKPRGITVNARQKYHKDGREAKARKRMRKGGNEEVREGDAHIVERGANPMDYLEMLPDELLVMLLEFMCAKDRGNIGPRRRQEGGNNVGRMRLVCRRTMQLVDQFVIPRRPLSVKLERSSQTRVIARIPVRQMSIDVAKKVDAVDLARLRHLDVLNLCCRRNLGWSTGRALLQQVTGLAVLTNLTGLTLRGFDPEALVPAVAKLTNLRTLLEWGSQLEDGHVSTLASRLPNLTKLQITGSITSQGIESLSQLRSLTDLSVTYNVGFVNRTTEVLAQFTNLRRLAVDFVKRLGYSGAAQLSRLQNLVELRIVISEPKFNREDYMSIASLTRLEELSIQASLRSIEWITTLTRLRTLYVARNELNPSSLESLVKLPSLTSLNLDSNRIGEGAIHLGSMTALTFLNVCSMRLSCEALSTVSRCTNLTTLNPSENEISDELVSGWARSLTKLTTLHLKFMRELSSDTIAAVGRISSLTKLGLTWSRFTSQTDIGLLTSLTNLTHLNVRGCGVVGPAFCLPTNVDTARKSEQSGERCDCGLAG